MANLTPALTLESTCLYFSVHVMCEYKQIISVQATDQKNSLTRIVAKEEIFKTLTSLPEWKSPSPDGMMWNSINSSRKT